jgi:transcriptional regulator with XRE-family HTH domain
MGEDAAQRSRSAAAQPASAANVPEALGAKIRAERAKAGMSVRELARRVEVSHSLISQIERGNVTPSVGTLWSIATVLGLSVADLFSDVQGNAERDDGRGGSGAKSGPGPVQPHETRSIIRLAEGVQWERLTTGPDEEVDFVYVVYPVGSSSCDGDALIRHGGREFGYVISGRLGVQIGFDEYEVGPDDSISFESTTPHRLYAIGDEPVNAIWMVINRRNDARAGSFS